MSDSTSTEVATQESTTVRQPQNTIVDGRIAHMPDPNEDPAEVAAMMFSIYLPQFESLVDQMTGKAVRRLLKSLIRIPLIDTTFNSKSEMERSAFAIGDRLMEAKMTVILSALSDNQTRADAEESSETNEEGKNDGIES